MRLKAELHLMIGVAATLTLGALGTATGLKLHDFYRFEAIEAKGRAMARVLAPSCAHALQRGSRAELDHLIADLRRGRDAVGGAELDIVSLAVIDDRGQVVTEMGIEGKDPGRERQMARARLLRTGEVDVDYPPGSWAKDGEALAVFA